MLFRSSPVRAGAVAASEGKASSSASSGGDPRYKCAPRVFASEPGERFLFQTGESMALHELPAGTRVVYLGMRADADSDRGSWRSRIRAAFEDPVDSQPLRQKLRELKARKPDAKVRRREVARQK